MKPKFNKNAVWGVVAAVATIIATVDQFVSGVKQEKELEELRADVNALKGKNEEAQ